MSRLRAFLFCVRKPDGSTEDALFYAASAAVAKRYAEAWAARLGYRVAIVPDRERAA